MRRYKIRIRIAARTLLTAIMLIVVSCAPQTKEAYLEQYKEFIAEVSREFETYTIEDWDKSLEQYERFSSEWFRKFKDEFTWQEQLLVGKYEIQYNLMRVKNGSANFFENSLEDNFLQLKEQVAYYYENEMEEDIEFLVEQAKEIGDSAISVMKEILDELEIEMEELFD